MSVVPNEGHANPGDNTAVVLILAGGLSRRFGGDKRIALVDSGNTLLEQSIYQFKNLGLRVIVCLSMKEKDDALAGSLRRKSVECLRCTRSEEGMGATLADGVAFVSDAHKIVVALADMPALMPETILRLLDKSLSNNIVFPIHHGTRGHPVIFGRRFFSELQALSGDRGASKILNENGACCVPLAVEDPGVLLDVDTPGDLERLKLHFHKRCP